MHQRTEAYLWGSKALESRIGGILGGRIRLLRGSMLSQDFGDLGVSTPLGPG
jgi:hypothetical protein